MAAYMRYISTGSVDLSAMGKTPNNISGLIRHKFLLEIFLPQRKRPLTMLKNAGSMAGLSLWCCPETTYIWSNLLKILHIIPY